MRDNWRDASDDELAEGADSALSGHGALVESTRRLRVSVDQLRKSSDNWARRLFWLTTISLNVLTVVLIALTGDLIFRS